jgi:DNA-binding SARP family transcriptional activator/tetratricopeptide (TPR) repeat protein
MHVAETSRLRIQLLGTFSVLLDDTPLIRFRSAKVRALLAYLAVESGRPHRREALATLLWGEYPERDAQRSLSQALTNLRRLLIALGPVAPASEPLLSITGQSVQLRPDRERVWVDVDAFDSLVAAADPRHASALEELDVAGLLAEAVALYQGPFLAGLAVADSLEFEEWLMQHRELRHQAVLLALERLVGHHLADGRTERVVQYTRRQLALEPWSESAHQTLMHALALQGQRTAALQQYEACRQVLAKELGVEPSAETEALVRQIRDGVPSLAMMASGRPPAPFVARERELARLDQSLARALAGRGRVIMVTGEAGTGKTALLGHFARHAQEVHHRLVVAGGRCAAYAGLGDPFLPFREILHALTGEPQNGWSGGRGDPEHARRLLALFSQAVEALLAEGPDLVGRLVSAGSLTARAETLAQPDGPWRGRLADQLERSRLSSQGKRARTAPPLQQEALFGQVTRVLQAVAGRQPLLLLIDDLQWADAASLSLLFYLARHLAGCRILVAGAYRPSEIAPPLSSPLRQGEADRHPLEAIVHEFGRLWGDIRVDLDQADGRRFVDALLDREPNRLGEDFRDRLAGHTGGHALFTIELLRAFQERGDLTRDETGRWVEGPDLRWAGLPPRVEAVIAERMGRLPRDGRRLLEAASVEGESFSAEVAARALGAEPAWALQWLSGSLSGERRLVQALGIQSLPAGGRPLSRYRFAHALFREYLYGRLDAVDRAHLHGEVGAALEGLCRGDEKAVAQASPQLAQHYEEAGLVLEAARCRLEAGRRAARLVAYDEAITHLERGLALLQGVAPSRERLHLEMGLCMAIGTPALLQRGWQAPVHTRALARLSDLTQHPELQDDPRRLTALSVLALSTSWSADPERSARVGEQLLDLAQDGDWQTLMLGHWALGLSDWLRGRLVPAREHLGRAVTLYNPEANRPLDGLVGVDPGVMAHGMFGSVLWLLGYPDQARASLRQAVLQAQELDQPSSLAFAHFMAVMMSSVLGRDVAAALGHCEAMRPLGQVSLVYGVWADLLAAHAQAQDRQAGADCPEPGLEQGVTGAVEAGSTWKAAGSGAGYAGLLLLQADLCARAGRAEVGLEAMDRAQAWCEGTGVRVMEADVRRMRGEVLLLGAGGAAHHDALGEADASFHSALAVAREQGSRWLELRAAVSLARLWRAQGQREEARELLAGIYDWFTEGFDTVDLVEAKALLEELR